MKYYGVIGFASDVEESPGIWTTQIEERHYMGDFIRVRRGYYTQDINGGVSMNSNQISIIADPYAMNNFMNMRYAEYNGQKWIVEGVEINHPRLLLYLGGVYHD